MLRKEKGFTIIEIVAVLLILGILAAVAVPKYVSIMEQSRISAAQKAISEVKAQCSNYYVSQMLSGNGTTTNVDVQASVTSAPYLGPDYNVTTTTASSGILITVLSVKGNTLSTAQTGTWYYPGL